MPTQVYLGEDLEARLATPEETSKFIRRAAITEEVKKLYEEMDQIDGSLPQRVALITDMPNSEGVDTRTYVLGEPSGRFVNYKKLDLLMNAKTTKKLLKEFNKT